MTDEEKSPSSGIDHQSISDRPSFWAELKRRKVVRVAITYAVVAWGIMQVAGLTFEGFGIPQWAFRFVVIMLVCFFPVAVILAWAFELTPDGIKITKSKQEATEGTEDSKAYARKGNWLTILFAAGLPTLIFGALAIFFYFRSDPSSPAPSPASLEVADLGKSIAVLPLENLSPDPENAFFADGVQEDILTHLSKIEELLVISRSSTLRYRERNKSLKEIGSELEVRYLVEGSVRRAGNRVLVTAQLIDVETDAHLWAENFNRPLDDIFAIQAEIAKTIAGQLRAVITPEVTAKIEYRPTENQEAYDLFLENRRLVQTIDGNWDKKSAVLEQAVALDPNFAEAWAQLAIEYRFWWSQPWVLSNRDPELLAKAEAALDKAKELKPNMAYIPFAQTFFTDIREDRIQLLLRALSLDPNFNAVKRILGSNYLSQGRLGEAQHQLEEIYRSDPLNDTSTAVLVDVYCARRMWDKALAVIEKALDLSPDEYDGSEIDWRLNFVNVSYLKSGDRQSYLDGLKALPDFEARPDLVNWHKLVSRSERSSFGDLDSLKLPSISLFYWPQVSLFLFHQAGEVEALQARVQDRINYLDSLIKDRPEGDDAFFGARAIIEALLGDRSKMEAMAAQCRERFDTSPDARPLSRLEQEIFIAVAYLILDDDEMALSTLEAASKLPSVTPLNRELDLWFIFDRLRGNPRFDKLLED
jgi:TolB-like protein